MTDNMPNIRNTYTQMELLLEQLQENKKQEALEELALDVKITKIVDKAIKKNNEERDKDKKWRSGILEKVVLSVITALLTALVIKGLKL